ncbi:MAG: TolC family protein [Marivibrio sp.]|uniref:TolC family protein n=1 Tax=Marivibrio sp. TaxID=2039719 RepID=UPI0032EF6614
MGIGRFSRAIGVAVLLAAGLAACAPVAPEPFTPTDHADRVERDLKTLFLDQTEISGPLTLEEAIARALKYNLDRRLKLMEEAVSVRQLDVANMNLLPDVVANAGYSTRSNSDTTFNEARTSTSTTSDQTLRTADLTASWNILDFGIGYIRAQQQADLALIVRERRRQVIHNILQDTRAAYWRAAAAERALQSFEPLLEEVRGALEASERQAQEGVGALDALIYQRDLLRTMRQLESLRRDMRAARAELAVLMNVHPNSDFELTAAQSGFGEALAINAATDRLEIAALENRSELRSEAYQLRIKQREARAALLQMIPGLNLSAGINYTSDSYKANQRWYDGSLSLTWNIMNLFTGPRNIELAETEQELSEVRRLALSMAVIAQTNIAQLRFAAAQRDFELAQRLADVETRISGQLINQGQAQAGGARQAISGKVEKALADLRRDLAYADLQAAYGRLIASIGADPMVASADGHDLAAVTDAVRRTLDSWRAGDFASPDDAGEPLALTRPAETDEAAGASPAGPVVAPAESEPLAAAPSSNGAPAARAAQTHASAADVAPGGFTAPGRGGADPLAPAAVQRSTPAAPPDSAVFTLPGQGLSFDVSEAS